MCVCVYVCVCVRERECQGMCVFECQSMCVFECLGCVCVFLPVLSIWHLLVCGAAMPAQDWAGL